MQLCLFRMQIATGEASQKRGEDSEKQIQGQKDEKECDHFKELESENQELKNIIAGLKVTSGPLGFPNITHTPTHTQRQVEKYQ